MNTRAPRLAKAFAGIMEHQYKRDSAWHGMTTHSERHGRIRAATTHLQGSIGENEGQT